MGEGGEAAEGMVPPAPKDAPAADLKPLSQYSGKYSIPHTQAYPVGMPPRGGGARERLCQGAKQPRDEGPGCVHTLKIRHLYFPRSPTRRESEDCRARSKAIGSGPIRAGVRRFESGSSHCSAFFVLTLPADSRILPKEYFHFTVLHAMNGSSTADLLFFLLSHSQQIL
jgi:hypothetical protein